MRKKILSCLLSVILCISFVLPICAENTALDKFELVNQVALFLEQNYKFGVTSEQLKNTALEYMLQNSDTDVDHVLAAMLGSLDDYTRYFTDEEYKSFTGVLTASLKGIGVTVKKVKSGVAVTDVLEYSPAEKAGIRLFDVITAVDGTEVKGMDVDSVAALIRGDEGTSVRIGVKRIGEEETLYFDIVRANVEQSPVYFSKLDDETAYIYLSQLTLNSDVFIREALNEIDKWGIKKIVLDLRDNSGGYLDATVNICGMFVPEGVVGYIDYKDPEKLETFYSENKNPKYKLAVLINGNTASGAELLSGTIQDTGVGKLFGEQSFGKGTVQTTLALRNGGAIKVTIGKYYTAKKQDVAKNHINPDFEVENSYIKINEERFEPLDFDNLIAEGTQGKNVLAIEERLKALGYLDEADENADKATMEAIALLKTAYGQDPDFNADIDFLSYINSIEYDRIYTTNDRQFKAAYDYLKGLE